MSYFTLKDDWKEFSKEASIAGILKLGPAWIGNKVGGQMTAAGGRLAQGGAAASGTPLSTYGSTMVNQGTRLATSGKVVSKIAVGYAKFAASAVAVAGIASTAADGGARLSCVGK